MTLEALLMMGATWLLVTCLALRFFLRVLRASRNPNAGKSDLREQETDTCSPTSRN